MKHFQKSLSIAVIAALSGSAFAQSQMEEVVVTATKRAESLQDVPLSVSVIEAQTIERAEIRDLIDLQSVVPSLRVPQFQNSTQADFVIRGFGNGANNPGIEPSVAVFIDGVYRSRSLARIADLPNIQQIEVLRGPQSTLYGKMRQRASYLLQRESLNLSVAVTLKLVWETGTRSPLEVTSQGPFLTQSPTALAAACSSVMDTFTTQF